MFDLPSVRALIEAALAEDIGRGDLTTRLTVGDDVPAQARIVAKQDGVAAGLPLVSEDLRGARRAGRLGAAALRRRGVLRRRRGRSPISTGPGPRDSAGERVALNFLQRSPASPP